MPHRLPRSIGILPITLLTVLFSLAAIFGVARISEDADWYKRVVVICALLAAASGSCLFLSHEYRVKVSLSMLSVGACLFCVNLLLMLEVGPRLIRGKDYTELRVEAAAKAGIDFDQRSKMEVVNDLRDQGIATYPSYPSRMGLRAPIWESIGKGAVDVDSEPLLPLGGVSKVTTVLDNENGEYAIYKSDRFGFNNDDRIYSHPDGLDLLIVGDSFAHGDAVQQDQNTAGALRASGVNAASVGVLGNGPLFYLMSLMEYGKVLKPKVVVWFHSRNDLPDMLVEVDNRLLRRYYSDPEFSQNLADRQDEIDEYVIRIVNEEQRRLEAEGIRLVQGSLRVGPRKFSESPWLYLTRDALSLFEIRHLLGITKGVRANIGDSKLLEVHLRRMAHVHELLGLSAPKSYVYTDQELARKDRNDEDDYWFRLPSGAPNSECVWLFYQSILQKAVEITRGFGGKLYVAYLPGEKDYTWGSPKYRDELFSTIREVGIPIVDFGTKLEEEGDPLAYFPFRLTGHYNPEGYSLLASQILGEVGELSRE